MSKYRWFDLIDEPGWPKENKLVVDLSTTINDAGRTAVVGRAQGKTEYQNMCRQRQIKNVIFNDPATIVYWHDGTKTVVKCQDGDEFDPEKGLAMAFCKKFFGNRGNFNNVFKKYVLEYHKKEEVKK